MNPVYAAAVVLGLIAAGELISHWSRARVPSLLVAMLGVFIAAQLGLVPSTVVDDSLLPTIYTILVAPILFHMGSLIPLPTLLQQWRSVIVALSGIVVAVLLLAVVIIPLFSFEHFVAGAGPMAGGIVAASLTADGLIAAGVTSTILVIPALVLLMGVLPAMPITNFLLRRYAHHLQESGKLEELAAKAHALEEAAAREGVKKKLITLPAFVQDNALVTLFMVMVGGAVATLISIPTHIPPSLVALLLGVGSTAIGLTPERALEKASSFGFAMAAVIAIVMAPLARASMDDVLTALVPMLVMLAVGMVGIMLGGFLATKLLGWRPALGRSSRSPRCTGSPPTTCSPTRSPAPRAATRPSASSSWTRCCRPCWWAASAPSAPAPSSSRACW